MSERKVYLNGAICRASEAKVSVGDVGLLHGASTFTTMLARNGVVFRLDRHLARLMETIEFLAFACRVDEATLTDAVGQVLKANELSDAMVRITVTPGDPAEGASTTLVTADVLAEYPPQWYADGVRVVISDFRQPTQHPIGGHKTGCYLARTMARRIAAANGAEEALWFTTGEHLAEACFCNVFFVRGSKVYTPPLDTPVLPGIVRGCVLEICKELEIEYVSTEPLVAEEMLEACEMFITASCSGIRPVVQIERHEVGDGKVGPVTRRIMDAYSKLLDTECSK